MYAIETTIRMAHVDPAGTIFFARVPEVAYAAFEAYLDHVGWSLGENLAKSEVVTPVVNCTTDYKVPIRLSDRLQIQVDVERIGNSSYTLLFTLIGIEGQTRATVRVTQVAVNKKRFETVPLPDLLRKGLEELQALKPE